jgi:hypothetical protein
LWFILPDEVSHVLRVFAPSRGIEVTVRTNHPSRARMGLLQFLRFSLSARAQRSCVEENAESKMTVRAKPADGSRSEPYLTIC